MTSLKPPHPPLKLLHVNLTTIATGAAADFISMADDHIPGEVGDNSRSKLSQIFDMLTFSLGGALDALDWRSGRVEATPS